MSALRNIIKKEIRELFTPATFLPIIILALLFGSMGGSFQGIQEESTKPPIIGVINEQNTTFALIATEVFTNHSQVVFNSSSRLDVPEGLQTLKQQEGVALIIIPANFSDNILSSKPGILEIYWNMKGAGLFDSISSGVVEHLIAIVNKNISRALITEDNLVNASVVLSPTTRLESTSYQNRQFPGLSPGILMGMLSSQSLFVPIIIMMIIIMAGSIVIMSMALEKENKTLETLLTLPVKRTSIVTGKIVASAFIGLLLAVIYMIGMGYYFAGLPMADGGIDLAAYNLTLSLQDFLLIGVSLFLSLIAGLALCMLLGTFAKNYKSAQTLTFPVTMLAMIPMFLTMFMDFNTLPVALKIFVFAIPFSHPMMASRALIFDDYLLVIGGIIYVAIFALVIISIVVWVFKTDRLLTGTVKLQWLKKFKRRR